MNFELVIASCAQLQNLRLQAVRSLSGRYSAEIFREEQVLRSSKCTGSRKARAWLLQTAQTITDDTTSPVVWRDVYLPFATIASRFLLCLFVLYGLPTVIELLVLPYSSAVVNVLIGDLTSYLVLFLLGHKRVAAAIYLTSRLTELFLLENGLVRPELMLWLTDAIPSLFCAGVLCTKMIFLPVLQTTER